MDDNLKDDKWESDSEKSDDDEDSSVATEEKQDESKLFQTVDRPFFIYKLEANPVKYPADWNGPTKHVNGRIKVYGLIICVKDQVCYIRTSTDLFTHKPYYLENLKNAHDLVGCWVDLTLDINNKISELPFYLRPPIRTRVFKDFSSEKLPYLLLYDYVEVLDLGDEVKSKFLGRIENEIDLKRKNGKLWKHCNIEYMVECEFISGKFTYTMKTVKFHGSAPLHTGLPRLLSLEQQNDDKSTSLQKNFGKALYNDKKGRSHLRDNKYKSNVKLAKKNSKKSKSEMIKHINAIMNNQELQQNIATDDIVEIFDQVNHDVEVQENESTLLSKKKTTLITHADCSYALTLARYYLKNGCNVILQYNNPNNNSKILNLMKEFGIKLCMQAIGNLSDKSVVEAFTTYGIEQFGSIDVMFHFVSIYDAQNVRELLKENLDPYIEIAERMLTQDTVHAIQLIVVSPILYLNSVDEQVLKDVDTCLNSLRSENNKFMKANSADFRVFTRFINFGKTTGDHNSEDFKWQVHLKLMHAEKIWSSDT